jgi:hypothetical protein
VILIIFENKIEREKREIQRQIQTKTELDRQKDRQGQTKREKSHVGILFFQCLL